MNNKEFVSTLSQKVGLKNAETQKQIYQLIDVVSDVFLEGDSVSIAGFGSFEVKKKMERIIVNPTTQQRMLVPPKLVLGFRPSATWKDKLKNGGEQ